MGRPSKHKVGNFYGKLEVLEVVSNNTAGQHVTLRCLCHCCMNETTINGGLIHKYRSCGCQKHNSDTWKSRGAKTRPWQLDIGRSARNNVEYQYKRGAEKRGLVFNLTSEQFDALVIGDCVYCGDSLTSIKKGQGKTSGDFMYTGIDRVDSKQGYTIDNSVSCCWMCNNMKSATDRESFIEHIKKIHKHVVEKSDDE